MSNVPIRVIAREVEVPEISVDEVARITNIVFHAPAPKPPDLIFVFGNSRGNWKQVAELYERGYALLILASGYAGLPNEGVEISQAAQIRDALIGMGIAASAILTEERSTNTLENVTFSKRLLDNKGIKPYSILYVCLNGHSGRCYLTLKKYFSNVRLTASNYPYAGLEDVNEINWHELPLAIKKVYAEYLRILTYSERGDIIMPEQT